MKPRHPRLFLERYRFFKEVGTFLVVAGLIILTLIAMAPELFQAHLLVSGYLMLGAGIACIILNKGLEIIQQSRLKEFRFYCRRCGWAGSGEQWLRHECCPECDSEQVEQM